MEWQDVWSYSFTFIVGSLTSWIPIVASRQFGLIAEVRRSCLRIWLFKVQANASNNYEDIQIAWYSLVEDLCNREKLGTAYFEEELTLWVELVDSFLQAEKLKCSYTQSESAQPGSKSILLHPEPAGFLINLNNKTKNFLESKTKFFGSIV